MSKWHQRALLTLLAFASSWASLGAEEYRNLAQHFTVQLPPGWREATPEFVAELNELGKRVNMSFEKAFHPIGQASGACPYAVIQINPEKVSSYEEIEKDLSKNAQGAVRYAEGKLADIVKNPTLNSVVFDRKKNRAIIVAEMTRPDGRRARGVAYSMLGKDAIVTLMCYAYDEEFDANLPTFHAMAESFCFDPEYEFIARKQQPLWPVVIVVAGGCVVVIAIFYKLVRKPKPQTD
jgi:hypothetical protein